MRDFLMWMALFAIIDWIITRNKRRDQKRWPNIMRGEKYFRNPKRATAQSRQLADKYRKMRKQARTDKRTAEYLDRLDMELSSSGEKDRRPGMEKPNERRLLTNSANKKTLRILKAQGLFCVCAKMVDSAPTRQYKYPCERMRRLVLPAQLRNSGRV